MRTRSFLISWISLAILLVLNFPRLANAKAFIEPYIGLAKLEVHPNENFADVADSFGLGLKVGLMLGSKFFIGGDYMQAGPFEFGPLLSNAELTNSAMGLLLGADYRIARFWAGYYFDSEFSFSEQNSVYMGTAVKVGFGLQASQKFRANLEITWHDITKFESLGFSTELEESMKFITTMVTLSIPISLD